MFVARKLRNENIAEYLLYMWQTEDLFRSFHLDIDQIKEKYLSQHTYTSSEQELEHLEWCSQLIDMMRSEHINEHGHLQICKNVLIELKDLHNQLIASDNFPYYRAAYYEALPAIVELRKKSGDSQIEELEICFNLLYGIMLLRIQNKPIAEGTEKALQTIASYISMLAGYYHKNLKEPIEF